MLDFVGPMSSSLFYKGIARPIETFRFNKASLPGEKGGFENQVDEFRDMIVKAREAMELVMQDGQLNAAPCCSATQESALHRGQHENIPTRKHAPSGTDSDSSATLDDILQYKSAHRSKASKPQSAASVKHNDCQHELQMPSNRSRSSTSSKKGRLMRRSADSEKLQKSLILDSSTDSDSTFLMKHCTNTMTSTRFFAEKEDAARVRSSAETFEIRKCSVSATKRDKARSTIQGSLKPQTLSSVKRDIITSNELGDRCDDLSLHVEKSRLAHPRRKSSQSPNSDTDEVAESHYTGQHFEKSRRNDKSISVFSLRRKSGGFTASQSLDKSFEESTVSNEVVQSDHLAMSDNTDRSGHACSSKKKKKKAPHLYCESDSSSVELVIQRKQATNALKSKEAVKRKARNLVTEAAQDARKLNDIISPKSDTSDDDSLLETQTVSSDDSHRAVNMKSKSKPLSTFKSGATFMAKNNRRGPQSTWLVKSSCLNPQEVLPSSILEQLATSSLKKHKNVPKESEPTGRKRTARRDQSSNDSINSRSSRSSVFRQTCLETVESANKMYDELYSGESFSINRFSKPSMSQDSFTISSASSSLCPNQQSSPISFQREHRREEKASRQRLCMEKDTARSFRSALSRPVGTRDLVKTVARPSFQLHIKPLDRNVRQRDLLSDSD
jgi:hypothetical protein